MTESRKNRGMGNNHSKAWDNSPLWGSIEKPTDGCRHLHTRFTDKGQICKDCGEQMKRIGE